MFYFEKLWQDRDWTKGADTLTAMSQAHQKAADELKAMKAAGVKLKIDFGCEYANGLVEEDLVVFGTEDASVAERFGMYDQVSVSLKDCEPGLVKQVKEYCRSQKVGFAADSYEDIYEFQFLASSSAWRRSRFVADLVEQFPWLAGIAASADVDDDVEDSTWE